MKQQAKMKKMRNHIRENEQKKIKNILHPHKFPTHTSSLPILLNTYYLGYIPIIYHLTYIQRFL